MVVGANSVYIHAALAACIQGLNNIERMGSVFFTTLKIQSFWLDEVILEESIGDLQSLCFLYSSMK